MKIEDVEVHVGDIDRPYRVLGPVKSTENAVSVFSNSPKVEQVNSKLREAAAKLGGDAVVNVTYERGISRTSWKALTARGTAVLRTADLSPADTKVCPRCAEEIKAAARICRFCRYEFPVLQDRDRLVGVSPVRATTGQPSGSKPTAVDIPPSHSVAPGEPSAVAAAAPDEVLGTWIVREGPPLLLGDEVELRLRGGRLVVAAAGGAISTFDPKDVAVTAADDQFVRLLVSGQPLVALDWTGGIGGRALARRLGPRSTTLRG